VTWFCNKLLSNLFQRHSQILKIVFQLNFYDTNKHQKIIHFPEIHFPRKLLPDKQGSKSKVISNPTHLWLFHESTVKIQNQFAKFIPNRTWYLGQSPNPPQKKKHPRKSESIPNNNLNQSDLYGIWYSFKGSKTFSIYNWVMIHPP
jgi:hypothetical protein